MSAKKISKIGIIGTGFVGDGLKKTIELLPDLDVVAVLTQRNTNQFPNGGVYTNSVEELIEKSDLVVECNGDPVYATDILCQVMDANLQVVTMNAELHITSGTFLMSKGYITEAQGDQPGVLAAFNKELTSMGFTPLVYGNLKGFLNHNPTREEMAYWAKMQGISLEQVTGFTDGTKVNIEQALVANGLGAVIATQGMHGIESENINKDSKSLAARAKHMGNPISDYLLQSPQAKRKFPAGVFITAEYDHNQVQALRYLKLGDGPFYTLIRNYHLIHLEIPTTIRSVLQGEAVLLDNSTQPTASVCAIAKVRLSPGTVIKRADRNFQLRGEAIAIKDAPNHVPIGLMSDVVIRQTVEPGQMITFGDIDIEPSLAYDGWQYTLGLVEM